MKQACGFTLIEVLVFIIVSSLMLSVMLLGANTSMRHAPNVHNQWQAIQTARQCMEWFLQQRRVNGFSAITCPSTPATTFCGAPSGYNVTATVTCTTWNSDTTYKTLTIGVSGLASASLSMQMGSY